MASGKTVNYGLSQWEATDQVVRADFNADNVKIDTEIKEAADQAALARELAEAVKTAAYSPENAPFVVGTYTGNSANAASSSNSQTITIGFQPRLVMVFLGGANSNGSNGTSKFAMASTAAPFVNNGYTYLKITDSGFVVGSPNAIATRMSPALNDSGAKYLYVALK